MQTVTQRATRNRVDPFHVRVHSSLEKLESAVKRIGRGLIGVGWCLVGIASLSAVAIFSIKPLMRLRSYTWVFANAILVGVSVALLLWGLQVFKDKQHSGLKRWSAIVLPGVLIALSLGILAGEVVEQGFPRELVAFDLLLVLAALVAKFIGLRRIFEALAGTKKPIDTWTHGSATFATRKSVRASGINKNHNGEGAAIYIGHLVDKGEMGEPVFYSGGKHIATFGPTESFKTVGQVLTNLARYKHSALVLDIAGTAARCTARLRSDWSNVDSFNPFSDDPMLAGIPDHGFNPLLGKGMNVDHPEFIDNCAARASIVVPLPKDDNPHWALGGRDLIHALTMYVIAKYGKKATYSHVRWLLADQPQMHVAADGTRTYSGLFATLADMVSGPDLAPEPVMVAMRNKITRFLSTRDEIMAIISAALSPTGWMDSPAMRRSLSSDKPYDFDAMKRGPKPTTLYVCFPPGKLETHAAWLQLVLCSALHETLTPPGPHTILLVLDEFPVVGHMPQVAQCVSIGRKYGLKVWSICQTVVQLQDLYGGNFETFLSGCGAITSYAPGAGDLTMARFMSDRTGSTTARVASDHGKPRNKPRPRLAMPGDSEGFHLIGEPLMRLEDTFGIEHGRALAWIRPEASTCVIETPPVWNTRWGRGVLADVHAQR